MAMENRWAVAVSANNRILEVAPDDVSTLNRLGRALMELGQYDDARDAYTRSLTISPSNMIAQKNLARVAALQGETRPDTTAAKVGPQMFIAEPGKSAVTSVKLKGKASALAVIAVGEQVELVVNRRTLSVRDARGALLGSVEQRLARRIIDLMKGGNQYDAALVSAAGDTARVVIRETYQDPSQVGKVSFPALETAPVRDDVHDGVGDDVDDEEAEADDTAEETDDTTGEVEDEAGSRKPLEEPYFE
jgi:tetratricopeptide (TPR) repeat protein